jgi:hypothetical protein
MTTLITYHSSGGDQGRCDAKCYEAQHPDCDCICGGRNHGAGLDQALENTRELGESWIEHAKASGQVIDAALSMPAKMEALFSPAEVTR